MEFNNKRYRGYQTLPMVVVEELREAILNGELKAGEQLKQEEIAKRFESSLIPVREALRNLESEGLVSIYPNKGAFVSRLSPEKIRQIFETRIIIETGALERSLCDLTEEDLEQAAAYIDSLDQNLTGKELSHFNKLFHRQLYSRCQNPFLLELIDQLHQNVERYMRLYLTNHDNNEHSQESHRRLLQAAREKNLPEAKASLEAHMSQAMDDLIQVLSANAIPS